MRALGLLLLVIMYIKMVHVEIVRRVAPDSSEHFDLSIKNERDQLYLSKK